MYKIPLDCWWIMENRIPWIKITTSSDLSSVFTNQHEAGLFPFFFQSFPALLLSWRLRDWSRTTSGCIPPPIWQSTSATHRLICFELNEKRKISQLHSKIIVFRQITWARWEIESCEEIKKDPNLFIIFIYYKYIIYSFETKKSCFLKTVMNCHISVWI